MVLIIDFDGHEERFAFAKSKIPESLTDRVFILGAWTEPEDLNNTGLGTYEQIGSALARDCRDGTDTTWNHELLRCNAGELARLRQHVQSILF